MIYPQEINSWCLGFGRKLTVYKKIWWWCTYFFRGSCSVMVIIEENEHDHQSSNPRQSFPHFIQH